MGTTIPFPILAYKVIMNNLQIYESARVVENYRKYYTKLYPAEKVLIREVEKLNHRRSMLDLGVGAGRTTAYFAPLFEKYTGIDFSSGMIRACRNRYHRMTHARFLIEDVTSLPDFKEEKFDLIFFSLNGIDYLKSLQDRKNLFISIYQLLQPEGIFAFSTHNTGAIERLYSYQFPRRNPIRLITEIYRNYRLRKMNGPASNFLNQNFTQIYDGGENFGAYTAYIRPSFEIGILKESGFNDVQCIDIKGKEISLENPDLCRDNWIHYVCRK